MGSPALTSRGFVERDFEQVADFVDRAVRIAGMVLCVCIARVRVRAHHHAEASCRV